MRPKAGISLGGRYTLDRRLAIGGMGEVWVCSDSQTGRDVAVKVLREELTGQEDTLARLRTEARNAATLRHKNIAAVLDYGEEQGTGFLVMELVLGESMADLLEREPVLPPRRLLPILSQTARGLAHAHSLGVVHRDVKPGNILIERPGLRQVQPGAKITDFGVSMAVDQAPMTATGMVMGTAQYLAPEQAEGKPATGQSDIYALGVIAYEATAGKRPFTGTSAVDIAIAHVREPVPALPASTHPALAELIMRLLEKDPAERPESASALADELDALAEVIATDPLGAQWRQTHRAQEIARMAESPPGVYAAPVAPAPPPLPVTPAPVRVSASRGRHSSPGHAVAKAPVTPTRGAVRPSRLRAAPSAAPSAAPPAAPAAAPAAPTWPPEASAAPPNPAEPGLRGDVARLRPASPASSIRLGAPPPPAPQASAPPPPPPPVQVRRGRRDPRAGRRLVSIIVALAFVVLIVVVLVSRTSDDASEPQGHEIITVSGEKCETGLFFSDDLHIDAMMGQNVTNTEGWMT